MIQKRLTQELGSKLRAIWSKTVSEFIWDINIEKECKTIVTIKKIYNIDEDVLECENFNQLKGLVYIYDYNATESDFEQYTQDLKN